MNGGQKRSLDETVASVLLNIVIPLIGIIAWAAMVYAYVVDDKVVDIIWMTSALAVSGIGSAVAAFKIVKK